MAEAGSITGNPRNWRTHSAEQLDALRHNLDRNDWAGVMLYNARTDRLIDGHARLKVTPPEQYVPVMVIDVDESRERAILAQLDPIGGMAGTDAQALASLLDDIDPADLAPGLDDILRGLADLDPTDDTDPDDTDDDASASRSSSSGERFTVVAQCDDEEQQQQAFQLLSDAGIPCRLLTEFE